MHTIRPATPDDIPLILAFIRELAEYEREPDAVIATPELLHQHLFGPGIGRGPVAECLLIEPHETPGNPQGFALFFHNFSTWKGRPGIYLEDLYIRPALRAKGLGRALLAHLAQLAVSRGCARMEWAVLDWNQPAINFYASLGAQPMNEWTTWRLTGDSLNHLAAATL